MLRSLFPASITHCVRVTSRVAVAVLSLCAGFASAQGQSARVFFPAALPAGNAVDAGQLPSSERLTVVLTLAQTPAQSAALQQFLADVQDPSSPRYRRWLTPLEFAASYGATADEVAAATGWAEAQGLKVEAVSPANTRISVSGFVPDVQNAFAVSLHEFQLQGKFYAGATASPSLSAEAAGLFAAMDGLSSSPSPSMSANGSAMSFAALGDLVDGNTPSILPLASPLCARDLSTSQLAGYTTLLAQAAAQGITTLATRSCASEGFPSALDGVTAVALPGDLAVPAASLTARPDWQVAPGLPDDGFRHTPDLTATSLAALAATLQTIAGPNSRLGNINRILYQLGPTAGLYVQAEQAAAGTWEAATGLGVIDLEKLLKVFPRGTGSSFVSLGASSYAPTYGTAVTFTSSATSGTGGATPTGTVSYVTSTGTTLGTAALDASGNASFTTTPAQLAGGSYSITAQYSGDATYGAATSSPPAAILVKPANATLTATISSGNTVGGTYTIAVTATSSAGVGQPSGNVTIAISGTTTSYTQALLPAGTNTSSATFTEPASTVGTLTISANCAGDASFTCPNAFTGNVVVAKATPTFSIAYTPNPPVSGQSISLTGTLGANGTAPLPTGTVTFYDNGIGLNAATVDATGMASATGVTPTASTHAITAIYNGDPNYNTVTVNGAATGKLPTTTALAASAYSVTPGQGVTLTATISSAGATGTVDIIAATQGVLAHAVPVVNRVATFTTSTLAAGNYQLSATYSGDANYLGSTGSAPSPLVVASNAAMLTASLTPLSALPGSTAVVTATVTLAGSTTPTGTLTASITGVAGSAMGTLVASSANTATATISLTVPPVGAYTMVVACPAGDTFSCNTVSLPLTSTVTPLISTTTTLVLTPAAPVAGVSTVFTATVTPASAGAAALSGSVTFFNGTTSLGKGTIAAGVATVTATLTGTAPVSLTAVYSGDTLYATSTSMPLIVTPGLTVTGIVLSANPASGVAGSNVSLTAVVNGNLAAGISPTGSVSFYVAGASPRLLGTASLVTSGSGLAAATFFTSAIPAGSQSLYAVYVGDTLFAPATSATIAIGVADYALTFAPATLSLTAGASGTSTLTVATVGGFAGTIALACAPPPDAMVSCTLSQSSLAGAGTSTLTITTTAATTQAARNRPEDQPQLTRVLGGISVAAMICLLTPVGRRRRLPGMLVALLAISLGGVLGCSTQGAHTTVTPGSPQGTYNVTVNTAATVGSSAVHHDYTVQLTIQ